MHGIIQYSNYCVINKCNSSELKTKILTFTFTITKLTKTLEYGNYY